MVVTIHYQAILLVYFMKSNSISWQLWFDFSLQMISFIAQIRYFHNCWILPHRSHTRTTMHKLCSIENNPYVCFILSPTLDEMSALSISEIPKLEVNHREEIAEDFFILLGSDILFLVFTSWLHQQFCFHIVPSIVWDSFDGANHRARTMRNNQSYFIQEMFNPSM